MACGCQGQMIIPAAPPIPHAPVEDQSTVVVEQTDTSEDDS